MNYLVILFYGFNRRVRLTKRAPGENRTPENFLTTPALSCREAQYHCATGA